MLRKSKKGARNKCPLSRLYLWGLGVRITKKLSRDAGRDLEITSATRGVTSAYEASLRKSFRPRARLMDNPPSSAINGIELAVCGSSSVSLTAATLAGGVVWMA